MTIYRTEDVTWYLPSTDHLTEIKFKKKKRERESEGERERRGEADKVAGKEQMKAEGRRKICQFWAEHAAGRPGPTSV